MSIRTNLNEEENSQVSIRNILDSFNSDWNNGKLNIETNKENIEEIKKLKNTLADLQRSRVVFFGQISGTRQSDIQEEIVEFVKKVTGKTIVIEGNTRISQISDYIDFVLLASERLSEKQKEEGLVEPETVIPGSQVPTEVLDSLLADYQKYLNEHKGQEEQINTRLINDLAKNYNLSTREVKDYLVKYIEAKKEVRVELEKVVEIKQMSEEQRRELVGNVAREVVETSQSLSQQLVEKDVQLKEVDYTKLNDQVFKVLMATTKETVADSIKTQNVASDKKVEEIYKKTIDTFKEEVIIPASAISVIGEQTEKLIGYTALQQTLSQSVERIIAAVVEETGETKLTTEEKVQTETILKEKIAEAIIVPVEIKEFSQEIKEALPSRVQIRVEPVKLVEAAKQTGEVINKYRNIENTTLAAVRMSSAADEILKSNNAFIDKKIGAIQNLEERNLARKTYNKVRTIAAENLRQPAAMAALAAGGEVIETARTNGAKVSREEAVMSVLNVAEVMGVASLPREQIVEQQIAFREAEKVFTRNNIRGWNNNVVIRATDNAIGIATSSNSVVKNYFTKLQEKIFKANLVKGELLSQIRMSGMTLEKAGYSILTKIGVSKEVFQAGVGFVVKVGNKGLTGVVSDFAINKVLQTTAGKALVSGAKIVAGKILEKVGVAALAQLVPIFGQIWAVISGATIVLDAVSFLKKNAKNLLENAIPVVISGAIGVASFIVGGLGALFVAPLMIPLAPILIGIFVVVGALTTFMGINVSTLVPPPNTAKVQFNLDTGAIGVGYSGPIPEGCPRGWPVAKGLVSQGPQTTSSHHGFEAIDISGDLGTPIVATNTGVVTFVGWSPVGYGFLVEISSSCTDFSGTKVTYKTRFAHMITLPSVSPGQEVIGNSSMNAIDGTVLGYRGSTGNSSGSHVHYEIARGVLGSINLFIPKFVPPGCIEYAECKVTVP